MKALLVAIFALALAAPAKAADVDISLGKLHNFGDFTDQVVAVKNNGAPREMIRVECGFFSNDTLVASGYTFAHNVGTGQTAFVNVSSYPVKSQGINSATCRAVL